MLPLDPPSSKATALDLLFLVDRSWDGHRTKPKEGNKQYSTESQYGSEESCSCQSQAQVKRDNPSITNCSRRGKAFLGPNATLEAATKDPRRTLGLRTEETSLGKNIKQAWLSSGDDELGRRDKELLYCGIPGHTGNAWGSNTQQLQASATKHDTVPPCLCCASPFSLPCRHLCHISANLLHTSHAAAVHSDPVLPWDRLQPP